MTQVQTKQQALTAKMAHLSDSIRKLRKELNEELTELAECEKMLTQTRSEEFVSL